MTLSTLIATTVFFVFRLVDFSRGVILAFYILTLVFLIGKYLFMRLVLSRRSSDLYCAEVAWTVAKC